MILFSLLFFFSFSRLTQVGPLMDDSSLMPFKLIFASRSYSRHGSFYRHVQLFWLVTGKNLRLLSNLRDYWVLVHTISSILLMLVICVIRDLAPEQETPGKKRVVDLIYTRIDLSAFLTWSETNSTCHVWIRNRNVPASSTGFSKAQWGELSERRKRVTKREKRERRMMRTSTERERGIVISPKKWSRTTGERQETFNQFLSRSQRCWVQHLS